MLADKYSGVDWKDGSCNPWRLIKSCLNCRIAINTVPSGPLPSPRRTTPDLFRIRDPWMR